MEQQIRISVHAPALSRWGPVAATQLPMVEAPPDAAYVELSDPTEAIGAAFALRRLAATPDPEGEVAEPAVSIWPAAEAGAAPEVAGEILCHPRIWEAAGAVWAEARLDPGRARVYRLGWHAPAERATGPVAGTLPRSMTVSLERPSAMLGREADVAELAAAWKRTVGGSLSLELVAGEAGAGKTRLVAEAAREAARAGGLLLHADGGEQRGAPYAPFVRALEPLLGADSEGRRDGELAASLFGRILDPATAPEGQVAGGLGDERTPLFHSAIQQFERLARRAPLLLVAEDLHGWGASSLQLLEHLCRAGARMRMMVLATYRTTDLEPGGEAASVLARLREIEGAGHTELAGLGMVPMRGLAAAAGLGTDSGSIERAAGLALEETGGNPLFALELLGSLDERWEDELQRVGALPAPRSLQMLTAGRARSLGEEAFDHLSAAAAAGHSFEAALVAEAVGADPDSVLDSLGLASRAGLVAPEGSGRHAFTHAMTARTLYSELEPARRGELHRRLALALEARGDRVARADELAYHWQEADPADRSKALLWAQRAGAEALSRYDHAAAAEWFEQALAIHDVGQGGDGGRPRCELLIGLGTALRFSGEPRFRELLLEAARLAAELEDTELLVEAVLANNRGFPSSIGEYDHERVALLELALERMPESSPERAAVLAQLALELTFSRQLERRQELAGQALEVARASGEERVLARILIRCLIARWGPDNARERIADAAESISISSRLDEPLDLFHGLHWQAAAQLEVMLVEDAARNLQAQGRIASRLADQTAQWLTACSQALRVAISGRLDEAEALTMEAMALGRDGDQPDALPFFASQIAAIRWQQGRLPELMPVLVEALEHHPGLPAFRSLLALGHALGGDLAAGREVVDAEATTGFSALPLDPVWLAAVVTYAHAVAELGASEHAEMLHGLLEPFAGRLATTSVSAWGTVDHALGRLAALRGDAEAAERSLARSLADYRRISGPVWRGHALLDLARARLALGGDGDRVEPLLAEAREVARRHGAGLLVKTIDERQEPREEAPEAAAAYRERLAMLGLTERQAQVVELLARGHGNAAIASALDISPSTVKRHLENVFSRVGVRNRGELIARLLDPDEEEVAAPRA